MQQTSASQQLLYRDGTSQTRRVQVALDPDYVAVDERSLKDLLAFAREYARELQYFAATNDSVQATGDWSAFLNAELDLDDVVAFMQEPEKFSPEAGLPYTQPHFVLFLTFLQLLRQAQAQLNTLTRRHLDFYYQQVLHMSKRPGVADRVHVLLDLSADTEQFLLPAGTALRAGIDSLGQERFYRTDQEIVVNHAQVARLNSLFVDKRVIGIREAREQYPGPKNEAILQMLQIALGQPSPGNPLPRYDAVEVTYTFLLELDRLLRFVQSSLFMDFSALRTLLQLKEQRDHADAEWQEINHLLEKAGQKRTQSADFHLDPASRNFDANLQLALGGPPNFDTLTEVKTIYDLYDQRIRESVQQFIHEKLYFDKLDDFYRLMQLKVKIDKEWQEINRILEQAGQSRRQQEPPFMLPPGDPTAFAVNLRAALGPLVYPSITGLAAIETLDQFYQQILEVERFFFLSAEDFTYFMAVAEQAEATPQEWNRVYALLADAYRTQVIAARRDYLRNLRQTEGFGAMLADALGIDEPESGLPPLTLLLEFVRNADDAAFLDQISRLPANAVRPADWERVYRVVEIAQRVRENRGEPVAQKEEWRNLYAAADATSVWVTSGLTLDEQSPRWRTFGQGQTDVTVDSPPPPSFGWAISSPLLALSQGQRTITLTLGFAPEHFDAAAIRALFDLPAHAEANPGPFIIDQATSPFSIQFSTEKGWIQADSLAVNIGNYLALRGAGENEAKTLQAIQFQLTFGDNVAALTPLPAEEAEMATAWPVLRLLLRQIWQPEGVQQKTGRFITHYQPFKALVLRRTHVNVMVQGLTPLQMQNDETPLATNKPFEPFGTRAVAGSHFYLGHPELIEKRLDSLKFHIEWMGAPANLREHYKNYPAVGNTGVFTARISLIDQRLECVLAEKVSLFVSLTETDKPHTITIEDIPAAIAAGRAGYVYERAQAFTPSEDLLTWNRYLQWELNPPDFQQETYPVLATQKAIELAAAIANRAANETVNTAAYQVNPPYTPKIKQVRLDYTAALEINLATYTQSAQLFHWQPFGYSELQPDWVTGQVLFLPQYDHEGELYIGLEGVQTPQNLSLLFQLAEGSADPDQPPGPVQWSYLSNNRWLSLHNGNVLQDTTRGLINTGIIVFALEPAQPNTLLSPELYWLRAAIAQHSASVCDTVAIHTQAVAATFADQGNAPDHLRSPLPAATISELAELQAAITGIRQPYTSYGGKMEEGERTFYTRISERLRHKHRALTLWDYEHMVLDRFPQLYKAKCLPANSDQPGQVELIVIPDIRNKLPFNPFEPKAPADLIADITRYLAANLPTFATVQVKNAYYVPVKVRFAVRFLPGRSEGYYRQLLNEELNHFLSPWAYEEGADIVIGGRIYANVIINFIEQRPYVDYVAQVKLFSSEDGRTFKLALPSSNDGYWVESNRPDSVLVAARQHEIDMITEAEFTEEAFTGINYMKIELDFIVAEDRVPPPAEKIN